VFTLAEVVAVTVGLAPRQADLMKGTASFVAGRVKENSIFAVLHRECHVLFADELFADLFADNGRRSVPPRIVAVVMVLQRLFGLSDRDAVESFEFDARWKYATGGLDFDYPGFSHTVLVDMRARLAASQRPRRIFEVSLDAARRAGLVGGRRVLDSTPLYDAVATMDTVTLVRSAIRQLLDIVDAEVEAEASDHAAARAVAFRGFARWGCFSVVTSSRAPRALAIAAMVFSSGLTSAVNSLRTVAGFRPIRRASSALDTPDSARKESSWRMIPSTWAISSRARRYSASNSGSRSSWARRRP